MNRDQLALARQALGLPNPRRQSYANHFVAPPRGEALEAWGEMIRAALDGGTPTLPRTAAPVIDPEPDFWPDDLPPDD